MTPPLTTPLVISYSGVLRLLVRGELTLEQLSGAVFYFECPRQHFYSRSAALSDLAHNTVRTDEEKLETYMGLRAVVADAETQGRVEWRDPMDEDGWFQLNRLLVSNGLPTIMPFDPDEPPNGRYCYSAVEAAVKQQRLPYRVIWV